mgnify:CR=1 FL=1
MIAAASTSFFISCDDAAPTGTETDNDTTQTVMVDTTATTDVVPVDTATTADVDTAMIPSDTAGLTYEPQPVSATTEAHD